MIHFRFSPGESRFVLAADERVEIDVAYMVAIRGAGSSTFEEILGSQPDEQIHLGQGNAVGSLSRSPQENASVSSMSKVSR